MSSNSDISSSDDDSEHNFIPGIYNFESENEDPDDTGNFGFDVDGEDRAYEDEPLADDEWLKEYEQQQIEKEKRLASLNDRLSGKESVKSWCSCGYCSTEFLVNSNECYCCKDIEQCCDAMEDELVVQELKMPPKCITLHPAFETVCLNSWSLRLAASKYRTIDKRRYKQTGSEEAYLRSIAYREFTHLVHGRIGKNRIPLPACAYRSIRGKFSVKDQEHYTGFQDDDSQD